MSYQVFKKTKDNTRCNSIFCLLLKKLNCFENNCQVENCKKTQDIWIITSNQGLLKNTKPLFSLTSNYISTFISARFFDEIVKKPCTKFLGLEDIKKIKSKISQKLNTFKQ